MSSAIKNAEISKRKDEFNAFPASVEKTFFDKKTGGYVVTDNDRIASAKINKQELAKYEKEKNMCINFALAGNKLQHLKEVPRVSSPDVIFNGKKADLKSLSSHNNLVKEAKSAIKKQGAEIVLFEFKKFNSSFIGEIKKLEQLNIHGMYYIKGDNKIFEF